MNNKGVDSTNPSYLGININNAYDAFTVLYKLFEFTDKLETRRTYIGLFLDPNNKLVFHSRIPLSDALFVLTTFPKVVKEAKECGAVAAIISHNATKVEKVLDYTQLELAVYFIHSCDSLKIAFRDILVISKEGQFYSYQERKSYP